MSVSNIAATLQLSRWSAKPLTSSDGPLILYGSGKEHSKGSCNVLPRRSGAVCSSPYSQVILYIVDARLAVPLMVPSLDRKFQVYLTHVLRRRMIQTLRKGPLWFGPKISLTVVKVSNCRTCHTGLPLIMVIPRGQLPTIPSHNLSSPNR